MSFADDLWLGHRAARRNLLHLMTYSSAFCAHAAVQTVQLAVSMPRIMVSALARAAAPMEAPRPIEVPAPLAEVETPVAPLAAFPDAAPNPPHMDEPRT